MSYQSISIVLTEEDLDLSAFNAARDIAARNSAHLEVFCLGFDPMRYDMVPMGSAPALTIASTGEAHEVSKRLVAWAEARLKKVSFGYSVRPLVVSSVGLESAVARMVRFADLIIASQPYGEGSSQLQVALLESVLFGTGAPVLVVPQGDHDYSRPFDRPLVAWNESNEALSAVRAAMPALKEADRVEIIMIDPPSHSPERSDPGGAICMMIARHGVTAEVSILAKTMPQVSEVIKRHAGEHSNDLIVMGAYGHSRFREALIGGATREMLETTRLPLLMAH